MNIGYRLSSPYMVICRWVSRETIATELPPLINEVREWLEARRIDTCGPAFFEYRVMNGNRMHVCVGFPVAGLREGDEKVHAGAFPEGDYATVTYNGSYAGLLKANTLLNEWFQSLGYEQRFLENSDKVFSGSRTEFYLTDPATEPDETKWKTKMAVYVTRAR